MEYENPFHKFEHEGWQKVAEQYGPGFGPVTVQATASLLHAVRAGRGIRLLDVACGPGYIASSASRLGCSVVGIDFSSAMIGVARSQNPGLEFREGDAENLDIPDSSFDAVAMNFGMLHLSQPDKAISEAFRVLRPGGRYAFTVWDVPPKTAGFEIVLSAVRRFGDIHIPLPEGPPFFRFSDSAECSRTLTAAGFVDVETIVVPQIWTLESGREVFETMRRAAVRTAALLNMQESGALREIEREIVKNAEAYRIRGEIQLPMPAILTSAAK